DEENPYKKLKVGDSAKYSTYLKTGGTEVKGVRTQSVTATSDKELTLKSVTEIDGKELPSKRPEQKIDLTKPLDLTSGDGGLGSGFKWEKLKDGQEKLKVGGKEYDCTWTTYKPILANGTAVEGELKVWLSKDIPFVMKRTLNVKLGTQDLNYSTE